MDDETAVLLAAADVLDDAEGALIEETLWSLHWHLQTLLAILESA